MKIIERLEFQDNIQLKRNQHVQINLLHMYGHNRLSPKENMRIICTLYSHMVLLKILVTFKDTITCE